MLWRRTPTTRATLLPSLMIGPVLVAGCGFPFPALTAGGGAGECSFSAGSLSAAVTTVSSQTELPTTLSGTLSGEVEGTYEERILEIFFDDQGAPVAGTSQSVLTLTAPGEGELVTFNLITVDELVVMTDDNGAPLLMNGQPVVVGLRSSSAGEVLSATGDFQDYSGEIRAESVLSFTGGAQDLGALATELTLVSCSPAGP